jgi:hypothetical protein
VSAANDRGTLVSLGIGDETVLQPAGWLPIAVDGATTRGFAEPASGERAAKVTITIADEDVEPVAVFPTATVIEDVRHEHGAIRRSFAVVETIAGQPSTRWQCWVRRDDAPLLLVTATCNAARCHELLPTFVAVVDSLVASP